MPTCRCCYLTKEGVQALGWEDTTTIYHYHGKSHKEQLIVVACAVLRVGHHAPASLLLGK